MKLEGSLPVPTLSATLDEPIGKAWRIVRIAGVKARRPSIGHNHRTCGACGSKGHQRNSDECPERDA